MKLKMYYKLTYSNGIQVTDLATKEISVSNKLLPPAKRLEDTELYAMDKLDAWNFLNDQYEATFTALRQLGLDNLDLSSHTCGRYDGNMIYMGFRFWEPDPERLGHRITSQGVIEFGRHQKRSDTNVWHYNLRAVECEDPHYPNWSKDNWIWDYEWQERE